MELVSGWRYSGYDDRNIESRILEFEDINGDDISEVIYYGGVKYEAGDAIVLEDDLNDDGINDIIIHESFNPMFSQNNVNRYILTNTLDKEEKFGIINTDDEILSYVIIPDVNEDGINDIAFVSYNYIGMMAAMDPVPIFLSGFFREDILMAIFGVFVIFALFYGLPFYTAFTYMFLAIDVMDFKHEENSQKLYKKMEKHDYDITPRKIINLYPEGKYIASMKMSKTLPNQELELYLHPYLLILFFNYSFFNCCSKMSCSRSYMN